MAKQKMICVQKCYANDRIYNPGDEFEYDGVECRAFHKVAGKPIEKPSIDHQLDALLAPKRPVARGSNENADNTKRTN